MGDDVGLTGVRVMGAALVADGRAMHVSGFPIQRGADQCDGRSAIEWSPVRYILPMALPREPDCYWVEPDRLLAGRVSGIIRGIDGARQARCAARGCGIRTFVDLTQARELEPYESLLIAEAEARALTVTLPPPCDPRRETSRQKRKCARFSRRSGRPSSAAIPSTCTVGAASGAPAPSSAAGSSRPGAPEMTCSKPSRPCGLGTMKRRTQSPETSDQADFILDVAERAIRLEAWRYLSCRVTQTKV